MAACPVGRRLTLPFRNLQGWLAFVVACQPCLSLCFLPPSPLPPSPPGKGELFTFHMQGASPLASPRLRRRRHGLNLRCRCPLGGLPGWSPPDLAVPESAGGLNPSGTCSPCPGGEDHLKRRRRLRRIVPSPPVPLSLAAGTANRKAVLSVLRRTCDVGNKPPPGITAAGRTSAAQVQPRGCKGRSPLHKIT